MVRTGADVLTRLDGLGGQLAAATVRYAEVFRAARDAGLHALPHVGETVGPTEIWSALRELGAKRIGHGITAVHDPALLDHLAQHSIALEVCPTSNLCTGAVTSLAEHPPAHVALRRCAPHRGH